MDAIRIIGLQFNALHGVRPEEKTLTQPFEVDVEILSDLSAASSSDELDDTINYSTVVKKVGEVVNGTHCNLLEKIAGKIIENLTDIIKEGEIIVRVRKPRAPLQIPFSTVEVELKRKIRT